MLRCVKIIGQNLSFTCCIGSIGVYPCVKRETREIKDTDKEREREITKTEKDIEGDARDTRDKTRLAATVLKSYRILPSWPLVVSLISKVKTFKN